MAPRALTFAAVVAALSGCASMQTGGPPPSPPPGAKASLPCMEAVCFVEVSVVPDKSCADPNNILVSVDPLKIARANPNPTITIQWDIDRPSAQAGYTFEPTKGIAFAPNTQFDCRRQGAIRWMCQDKNDDANRYKYAVNLKKGDTACASKDPFVINGQ